MGWLSIAFGALKSVPELFGLASKGLDYFIKKADGDVQKAIAMLAAYKDALAAQRDVTLAAMNHPVWWVLYALFVVPTGIHYGKCVLWDTTFGLGTTPPLHGYIRDWAGLIVSSIVGLQVGSGIIGGILNRIFRK